MKRSLLLSQIIILVFFSVLINNAKADYPRKIIVEEATNSSCGPCATHNPNFKKWFKSKSDVLMPVIYHAWWPGPKDPMYLYDVAMQKGRISTYYAINSVPFCYLNGILPEKISYWAGCPGDTVALNKIFDTLSLTSPINISIDFQNYGHSGVVNIDVTSDIAITGKKLQVVLLEKYHYYENAGSNGEKEFEFLACGMLPNYLGTDFSIEAAATNHYTFNYSISNAVNTELYAVAFIQDNSNKKILQANWVYAEAKFEFSAVDTEDFYLINQSESITKYYELSNHTTQDIEVSFEAKSSDRSPDDWTFTLPEATTIKANTKSQVPFVFNTTESKGIADFSAIVKIKDTEISFSKSVTLLSKAVQSLFINGGADTCSIKPAIELIKTSADYIEITSSQYPLVENSLPNLKYLVWDLGTNGSVSSENATQISNLINNNIHIAVIGNQAISSFNTYGILDYFSVEYLGYHREGYDPAPYRFWLTGVSDEPITRFISTKIEGHLINYLLPVMKITGSNTYPLLHFANNGRYVSYKDLTDTIDISANDAIFAVRTLLPQSRAILMGFSPETIVNSGIRNDLITRSIEWLENGIVDVKNPIETTKNNILMVSPNPVIEKSIITLNLDNSYNNVKLSLYNYLAEDVMNIINQPMQSGSYNFDLNSYNLPSGKYNLVLRIDNNTITQPIMIIK